MTTFAFQLKRTNSRKRTKIYLPIIWNERIHLLQGYFSYFIAKQGTIFKDICIKKGTQFCSAFSSSGLIYYGPADWSFRRQISCANYFVIIIFYEGFIYIFPSQFFPKIVFIFFAFWRKEIRRHLAKIVLF